MTSTSRTLIDHIITNYPHCVPGTDIIPGSTVSDHDGVLACVNVRVPRYQPRYKWIRHEKNLNEEEFKKDCSKLPKSAVYCLESLEDMVDTLNTLLINCIDRHAPPLSPLLWTVKVTRPPAPWKQSRVIQELKIKRVTSRAEAHATNTAESWNQFKQVRNDIKSEIGKSQSPSGTTLTVQQSPSKNKCRIHLDEWKSSNLFGLAI